MKNHYIKLIMNTIGIKLDSTIVIWGSGIRGKRVLESMMNIQKLGNVSQGDIFFCDINKSKQGNEIYGKLCLSPDELEDMQNLVIIFSVGDCEAACKRLEERYVGRAIVLGEDFVEFIDNLPQARGFGQLYPLGHFYNLYPNLMDIRDKSEALFSTNKTILDIDLNETDQLKLLDKITGFYGDLPEWKKIDDMGPTDLRYRYLNDSFSPGDSITLHCMMRILKPKHMIEVGSGWTSALTLDTNEHYLNHQTDLTFIEPYPQLLKSLLKLGEKVNLITSGLQEVPLEIFKRLEEGDVLFIDSTHVSKIGSDVNYLFFEILPNLRKGVYIHLHDIFYPFEYPEQWMEKGMIWNELYLLRAFLMDNKSYKIIFFQSMMEQKYKERILSKWPLHDIGLKSTNHPNLHIHGGSMWLVKVK